MAKRQTGCRLYKLKVQIHKHLLKIAKSAPLYTVPFRWQCTRQRVGRGGSLVESIAVDRRVVGSNPAPAAT